MHHTNDGRHNAKSRHAVGQCGNRFRGLKRLLVHHFNFLRHNRLKLTQRDGTVHHHSEIVGDELNQAWAFEHGGVFGKQLTLLGIGYVAFNGQGAIALDPLQQFKHQAKQTQIGFFARV